MGFCLRLAWLAAGKAVSGCLALCHCLPTHQQTDCFSFKLAAIKEAKLGVRFPSLISSLEAGLGFSLTLKNNHGWQTV